MAKIKRAESAQIECGVDRAIEKYSKRFRGSKRHVNEIQRIYAGGILSEKWKAFKLFSMDASDLTVLENIEKPLDPSKRGRIMRELRQTKSFLNNLDALLQKAQEEKDIAITDACTKALEKIMKVRGEIVRQKWYKTNINPISLLDVNED
jgi:hypothetical protein